MRYDESIVSSIALMIDRVHNSKVHNSKIQKQEPNARDKGKEQSKGIFIRHLAHTEDTSPLTGVSRILRGGGCNRATVIISQLHRVHSNTLRIRNATLSIPLADQFHSVAQSSSSHHSHSTQLIIIVVSSSHRHTVVSYRSPTRIASSPIS